jgi:hypothetical protein
VQKPILLPRTPLQFGIQLLRSPKTVQILRQEDTIIIIEVSHLYKNKIRFIIQDLLIHNYLKMISV